MLNYNWTCVHRPLDWSEDCPPVIISLLSWYRRKNCLMYVHRHPELFHFSRRCSRRQLISTRVPWQSFVWGSLHSRWRLGRSNCWCPVTSYCILEWAPFHKWRCYWLAPGKCRYHMNLHWLSYIFNTRLYMCRITCWRLWHTATSLWGRFSGPGSWLSCCQSQGHLKRFKEYLQSRVAYKHLTPWFWSCFCPQWEEPRSPLPRMVLLAGSNLRWGCRWGWVSVWWRWFHRYRYIRIHSCFSHRRYHLWTNTYSQLVPFPSTKLPKFR